MKMIISTKYVKNLFLLACFLGTTIKMAAQEVEVIVVEEEGTKPKFTFNGSVDAYYRTNLSTTDRSDINEDGIVTRFASAPGTSFADETGFALGMANLIFSYEGEKVGAVADVVFGPRGDDAVGAYNLNQLYAYVNVSEGTRLTMGRFNTYLGYEVISPTANFNYSTSYLFSNGPFSHVGLKADFALSEDFSLMLAIMNVTDVNNNLTGIYSAGAQLGYAGQYLNFYYDGGAGLGYEIDYTGGFDITDTFFFGINAAYADNDGSGFAGAALYPQIATSDSFSIGLRGEYFALHSDTDGGGDDPSVFAATLTGSYTIENLMIKPEIRLDSWNNNEPFFDNDLAVSKSLSSFLLAAIYSF